MDLPGWQALREELHPGLEVVTVALDTGGIEAAGPSIEAAQPSHPSLIDQAHLVDELFGVVNVPSGVWIDEEGQIVRPPESAFPGWPAFAKRDVPKDVPPRVAETLAEVRRIRIDPERYVAALRDWASNGSQSRYVLSEEEVLRRSRPRPPAESLAAAHFELAQHLHRGGDIDDAVAHFREAHRLAPDNWTYRRQAWSMVDPAQGPTEQYEGDWLTDVRRIGAENYYPALEM
jgi:tetratricopeptide (TPR) repeat protein